MRATVLLILVGLGWFVLTPAPAKVIDPQFGRGLWATGYVRSVPDVLVFDLGTDIIRGNTGGSKVALGTSTEHVRILRYLELAKKKGILVRLHGFFVKNPPNIMAQLPAAPSVEFRVDKMHSTRDPDR